MTIRIYPFWLPVLLLSLNGCLNSKRVIYLQGPGFEYEKPLAVDIQDALYKVQVSDVLNIRVINADAQLAEIFSLQPDGGGGMMGNNQLGIFLNSYIVNAEGNIEIPVLGIVPVKGLTTTQIESIIKERIRKDYLNEVTVVVRLPNFVVSVLGEVARPGRFSVFQERVSLLEALALAGDLDEFANRRNIKLIRQLSNQMEVVLIDLTSKDFLTSPYYFLKPNDIVYIEPMKAKVRRANLPLLGTIFSGISTTVLILNFLINN